MITLHTFRKLRALFLFFIVSLLLGCSGGLFGQKTKDPKADGFHTTLPKQGTHVVIWGDHSTAVAQAAAWLGKQGAIIIDDSRLQQAFKEHHIHPNGTPSDRARLLKAGELIGSDLVVFLNVEKLLLVREGNFVNAGSTPNQVYDLEIQGVDVQTGETVWQGHAKDSASAPQSEALVKSLTMYALEQAWGSPQQTTKSLELAMTEESPMPIKPYSQQSLNSKLKEAPIAQTQATSSKSVTRNETALNSNHRVNQPTTVQNTTIPIDNQSERNFNALSQPQNDPWEPKVQDAPPAQKDDLGIQVASGSLSLLYCPAKLLYAGVGSVIGGFAYVLSGGNDQVADNIWVASLQGTYIIRPSHLRGDEPVNFMGTSQKNFATIDQYHNSLYARDSKH